jgi:HEAT repeat protein
MPACILALALGIGLVWLPGCRPRVKPEAAQVRDAVASIVAAAAAHPDDVDAQEAALASLGESAIPHLAPALRHPDARIRVLAVHALAKMRVARAVDPLVGLLADPSWEVRQETVEALGDLRARGAVRPLLEQYARDPDPQVRYACLTSLGRIGAREASPLLVRETGSEDLYTRMWAMDGLCAARDPEAPASMLRMLEDPDVRVRRQVLRSCGTTIRTDATRRKLLHVTLDDPDFESSYVAREALVADYRAEGDAEGKKLIEEEARRARKSGEPTRARRGTFLLGNIGDTSAYDGLVVALHDGSPLMRHHAAHLLGEIRDPRAVKPLIAALRDAESLVRLTAMLSLQRYAAAGDRDARAALGAMRRNAAAPR